ncbi:MAG: YebC/PmpR family DNA-binding transcriptional regulator [Candidatus Marinimicrobia bacterium]|jgi:YebC/PmpR family DNA-binding regulatory protein|nr:YebC/PmpR family DNA-binding transcriptional regulator [Candidatus Neomarinimicrobiota bacterium]
MSGHSKWANIKHKKAATDAKRGKVFTKILKEITVAARTGGSDQDANPRLRTAIDNAKSNNIPLDTVNRAIKKGTGELKGVHYDEYTYEGYGPNGVALILEIMTDNKQRTVSEIRHLLTKFGGNLGESGSVAWNFNRKGKIIITSKNVDEDSLMMDALDAGAEDIIQEKDNFEIITSNKDFNTVKEDLKSKKYPIENSDIEQIPETTVKLNYEEAKKFFELYELLDDHDDIQKVWDNSDISEEILVKLEKEIN